MNIKATVFLLTVFAVCTATMTQARMTLSDSDRDDNDDPSNNDRRETHDGDQDRDDGNTGGSSNNQQRGSNNDRDDDIDDDRDDRSTRKPADGQGSWPTDKDNDRYDRSTRNPTDRKDDVRRTQTTPRSYPTRKSSGEYDGTDDRMPTRAYPMYNQTKTCFLVDLAFAVDTSGSIARENWTRVADFFNRFIARMEVSDTCARVSVVTFGSVATLQFDLLVHTDAGSLRHAIERLDVRNQTRNFEDGIRQVRSEVFQNNYGDRQDAPNVCVLITDGNSGVDRQNTLAEAARAKSDGISMHAVGIGKYVLRSELSLIADSPANAIHLNDFSDLHGEAVMRNLFDYMQGFKQTTAPYTGSTRDGNHQYTTPASRQSSSSTAHPMKSTRTTPATTTTTATTTENPTTTTTVATANTNWQCSFENATGGGSLCNMMQSSYDDFDWTLRSGRTPSSETGPNSAYGGSGYYIFIEASNPRRVNDKAMIMVPSFNQDGVYCLSFYYNMNGFHINKLQVVKRTSSGQLVNLWMKNHNQGTQWHAAQITANLYSSDQLAFIGIRGHEYSGDIAIDNVSVRSGICKQEDEVKSHS